MSTTSRGSGNRKYLLLTLIAFFLACAPSVLQRSAWTDEIYTLLLLSGHLLPSYPTTVTTPEATQQILHHHAPATQMLDSLIKDDVHPPVYFLLAHAWTSVFDQALTSLRWLSVVAGLLAIGFFYYFLETQSPSLANIATPVFAFSSGVLHYSTEARQYMPSLLGVVITLYLMGRIIAHRAQGGNAGTWRVAALAAATALSVLTNYLAAFPLAAAYLWFVVLGSNWRAGLTSGMVAALVFALWLPFLLQYRPEIAARAQGLAALSQELYAFDYSAGATGWEGLPRQLFLVLQGVFGSLFIASHTAYPDVLHWAGRLFLTALAALGAVASIARPENTTTGRLAWLFVCLAIAPAAGALLLYVLMDKQLYGMRYMMLAAPGLAGLCGLGIQRIFRHRAAQGVATGALALAFLLSVANWGYTSSYFQGKTVYRALAAALQREGMAHSLVIAGRGPMPGNTTALFYELPPDAKVLVLQRDSDVASVLAIAAPYEHVWLIRVRELTLDVEDELARTLPQRWEKRDVLEQIEHYAQAAPAAQQRLLPLTQTTGKHRPTGTGLEMAHRVR